jgi:hypothetical protein
MLFVVETDPLVHWNGKFICRRTNLTQTEVAGASEPASAFVRAAFQAEESLETKASRR